ncbi:receptor like protein 3-like [Olea europaea var. sylvestris]|uniref:receptor like protein 3-like n=1 Tax=Olea europaea var. sylvestris TaxID=158386 RepID=UPI000C1CEA0D|nr:receptor like protein 3-like [Olea europaea var. sylvestris]
MAWTCWSLATLDVFKGTKNAHVYLDKARDLLNYVPTTGTLCTELLILPMMTCSLVVADILPMRSLDDSSNLDYHAGVRVVLLPLKMLSITNLLMLQHIFPYNWPHRLIFYSSIKKTKALYIGKVIFDQPIEESTVLHHALVSIPFFFLVLLVFLGFAVNCNTGVSFLFCIYLPWLIWEGVGFSLNSSRNQLSGPIPDGFFTALNRLVFIDISHNRLTGQLSDSDKLMSTVTTVDLSSNCFYGRIQSSFLQPALNLQRFDVSNNGFSGSIPSSICRFSPSIVHLDFSNNDFGTELTGMIPQDIGRLSNLEQVNLLEGELSAFNFSKFIQLRSIDLGNNFFRGRLPSSIFLCKNLTAIRLTSNSLNGEVLPDIMALQSLSFLSLTNNSLNNITSAVRILTVCKNLRTLILSKNIYNEPLPGDENLIRAGEFQNLQVLGLGGCGFTGSNSNLAV